MQALSTLDSVTLMYPFFYRPMFEIVEDGWRSFLPDQEFELLSSVVSWNLRICAGAQIYLCKWFVKYLTQCLYWKFWVVKKTVPCLGEN